MKKILAILLAAVMLFGLTACGGTNDDTLGMSDSPLAAPTITPDYEVPDDFKVGFICLHDKESTYDKNFLNAVDTIKAALNLKDEQVLIKTNVDESNACYEAAKDLVTEGCKIVFANSFGHEEFMIKAAREFTNVQFCHATGTKAHTENLPNYHNAFASIYQGRYLAGIVAGMKLNEMIEEKKITASEAKIGYVGAFTYAEVISGYTSFYLGAKSVCPSVTMDVQFTGSWYSLDGEKSAAEALIANKCVLISQHADSMGAPSACEKAGVPNVSYNGSTYESCPETFLVSSAINWAPYYNYMIRCVVKGEAIAADWCGGIDEGSVVLSGINQDAAAEGTVEAIKKAIADLKAGTVHVFDTKNFTVKGAAVTTYQANVDDDAAFAPDTEVVANGIFEESKFRSAPYFDLQIDGINLLNTNFGD